MPLEKDEKELLESLEKDEWTSVKELREKKKEFIRAARSTTAKTKRVTLRMTEQDYELIHVRALQDGIPYQTLISSVVHRYLHGKLR